MRPREALLMKLINQFKNAEKEKNLARFKLGLKEKFLYCEFGKLKFMFQDTPAPYEFFNQSIA